MTEELRVITQHWRMIKVLLITAIVLVAILAIDDWAWNK